MANTTSTTWSSPGSQTNYATYSPYLAGAAKWTASRASNTATSVTVTCQLYLGFGTYSAVGSGTAQLMESNITDGTTTSSTVNINAVGNSWYRSSSDTNQQLVSGIAQYAYTPHKHVTMSMTVSNWTSGNKTFTCRINNEGVWTSHSVTMSTPTYQATDITYNIDYILGENGQFSTYGENGLRSANGGMEACNPTTARVDKPPNYAGVTTTSAWFYVEEPTRKGYTFNGWTVTGMDSTTHHYYDISTSSNATSTATSWTNTSVPGQSHEFYNLRGSAGTVTFTANWIANTYTLVYDSNGGTGSVESQSCTYDVPFEFQPNGFTREGYTFLGWTNLLVPALNGEIRWEPGEEFFNFTSINHNTCIIYAVWRKNPTLAVNDTDWEHISGVWVQQGGEWKKAIGIWVQSGGQWVPAFEIPDLPS